MIRGVNGRSAGRRRARAAAFAAMFGRRKSFPKSALYLVAAWFVLQVAAYLLMHYAATGR